MNAKPEQKARATALLKESPWRSDRKVASITGLGNSTVSRLRAELGIPRGIPRQGATGNGLPVDGMPAVEVAVAAGASERKLRRWHSEGLLAEPRWYWDGKRRIPLYTLDDVERVRAIGELMARYRSVDSTALGLFALGYTPSEERLRGAYDRFLARFSASFAPWDAIFNTLRDAQHSTGSPELDANVALVETLVKHPNMEWARRTAVIHESDDWASPDATRDYLENVSSVYARGTLGSDEAVESFLSDYTGYAEAQLPGSTKAMREQPKAEQIDAMKGLQRAMKISTLRRIAAKAPMTELTEACDEVTTIFVGYLIGMDASRYLGDTQSDPAAPLACELVNIDPRLLAYFGLLAASAKRAPDVGPEIIQLVNAWRHVVSYFVTDALVKLNGQVCVLDKVARRYLNSRLVTTEMRDIE